MRPPRTRRQRLRRLGEWQPELIITDIHMPGMDGLDLLAAVREKEPDIPVVLLTAYGSLKTAVDAIKAGAFDYLSKPFVVEDIRLVVRRALEHTKLVRENRSLRDQLRERYRFDNLVGSSGGMVEVYKLIARVAETDSTILIQGESGTGKELIARAIHANSGRSGGPFVAIDTGSLAETLLESELFGHERGAFTGAVAIKKGLLEQAHLGTCFLDEIADLSPMMQSKLLRSIQEREIRRVGSETPRAIDVRIIAASKKALKPLVEAGTFREDLFYRLEVITIVLPPLRDRIEDIPLLSRYFVDKFGRTKEKPVTGLSPDTIPFLTRYSWPGNVRELEHVIERAIALTPHPIITPEDLAGDHPDNDRSRPGAGSWMGHPSGYGKELYSARAGGPSSGPRRGSRNPWHPPQDTLPQAPPIRQRLTPINDQPVPIRDSVFP